MWRYPLPISYPTSSSDWNESKEDSSWIYILVGAIVGVVLLIVIPIAILLFVRRRKSSSPPFDSIEMKAPASRTSVSSEDPTNYSAIQGNGTNYSTIQSELINSPSS